MSIGKEVSSILFNMNKINNKKSCISRGLYDIYMFITSNDESSFHYTIKIHLFGSLLAIYDGCFNNDVSEEYINEIVGPMINKIVKLPKHKL